MPGLPPGWEKVLDRSSGQYYFYNARLGVTQWDPPQVSAQKTKATFVTTTTRKVVTKKPRAVPDAFAHRAPVHTTTVVHTSHSTSSGRFYCDSGDVIFLSVMLVIVIIVVVCMNTIGERSVYGQDFVSPYETTGNNINGGQTTGCGASNDECVQLEELLKLVNSHRQSIGVARMGSNAMLNTAAQRHSCYMAEYKKMSHTGGPQEEYREMANRIKLAGYKYSAAGENVAAGQKTAQSVMTAWLNSPGHKRNIEKVGFEEIGLGLKESDDGIRYWTQVFGKQLSGNKDGATNWACAKQVPNLR